MISLLQILCLNRTVYSIADTSKRSDRYDSDESGDALRCESLFESLPWGYPLPYWYRPSISLKAPPETLWSALSWIQSLKHSLIILDYSLANRLPSGPSTKSLVALFPKFETMKYRSITYQTLDHLVPFMLCLGYNWPFPDWFLYSIPVECASPPPTSAVRTSSLVPQSI